MEHKLDEMLGAGRGPNCTKCCCFTCKYRTYDGCNLLDNTGKDSNADLCNECVERDFRYWEQGCNFYEKGKR